MKNKELLISLKSTTGTTPCLGIPIGQPIKAFMRPVVTKNADEKSKDVIFLTEWRNRFVTSFLTEFEATPSQTAKWLSETVEHDDTKILFMVDDLESNTFAYIGIAFINWDELYCEADSVVRGNDAPKGTMTEVLRTLLYWAKSQLGIKKIGVRVRSDNPALSFYYKFGFQEIKRVPLKQLTESQMTRFIEDETLMFSNQDAGVYLVHMILPEHNF